MKFKRKLILMSVLIASLALCYLPAHSNIVRQYDRFIFYPFQSFRGILFGFLPFSLGDVVYILGGIWLIATVVKWIKYLVLFRRHKERLALSLLRTVNTILFVYLFFFLGWGANYYKQPLRVYWELAQTAKTDGTGTNDTGLRRQSRADDSAALVTFDSFLVSKLNLYAPHVHALSLREVTKRTVSYYKTFTDCQVSKSGLGVKPSFFGYFMQRTGTEGYYNPFTGEGQVDNNLPCFLMPFLVSHEIAHQAGIAAEDDANLAAYALGTTTEDSSFRYSSYFNIWIYTNNRLYRRDTAMANRFERQLNRLTAAHMDTLEQISSRYQNQFARYSRNVYDSYLKMQDQKDGIRSYSNVASSAWKLELLRMAGKIEMIRIP